MFPRACVCIYVCVCVCVCVFACVYVFLYCVVFVYLFCLCVCALKTPVRITASINFEVQSSGNVLDICAFKCTIENITHIAVGEFVFVYLEKKS